MDPKNNLDPALYHEQEHLPQNQVDPSPIQPDLEHFQGWGIDNISW